MFLSEDRKPPASVSNNARSVAYVKKAIDSGKSYDHIHGHIVSNHGVSVHVRTRL